jgi:hypothetical protein
MRTSGSMSGVWKRSRSRYWDPDGQDGPVTFTRPIHHRATPRLYRNAFLQQGVVIYKESFQPTTAQQA